MNDHRPKHVEFEVITKSTGLSIPRPVWYPKSSLQDRRKPGTNNGRLITSLSTQGENKEVPRGRKSLSTGSILRTSESKAARERRYVAPIDPFDVGITSCGAVKWRDRWSERVLRGVAETSILRDQDTGQRGSVHLLPRTQSDSVIHLNKRITKHQQPKRTKGNTSDDILSQTMSFNEGRMRRPPSCDVRYQHQPHAGQSNTVVVEKVLTKLYPCPMPSSQVSIRESDRYDGLAQVKGSQPRWLGLPRAVQDESHTGAKMQVWPPAVPPPDPPGYKWQWLQHPWPVQEIAEILAEQRHSRDYVRARAMTVTFGVADAQRRAQLPDELFADGQGLWQGVRDAAFVVRFAAAVSLATLMVATDATVQGILTEGVVHRNPDVRWQAARCLASLDVASVPVVQELLSHLVNVAGDTQRAEAIALATTLSRVSQLVRALAGEMLNSAEGSVRLEAVRLLPLLHGHTSRDIADKLLAMMWGDLHAEVRDACLVALGLTNNAMLVHDAIVHRLESTHTNAEKVVAARLAALAVAAGMKRTTPRMFPGLCLCLRDASVLVQVQACLTMAVVRPLDESTTAELVALIPSSNPKQTRLHALRALACMDPGILGRNVSLCRQHLVRIMRYEADDAVVVEAAAAVHALGLCRAMPSSSVSKRAHVSHQAPAHSPPRMSMQARDSRNTRDTTALASLARAHTTGDGNDDAAAGEDVTTVLLQRTRQADTECVRLAATQALGLRTIPTDTETQERIDTIRAALADMCTHEHTLGVMLQTHG